MIYFDNAATTYPKPNDVYEALDYANRNAFNSGRGSYKSSKKCSNIIDEVRNLVLKVGKIDYGKVIFTDSATTALNRIIFGIDLKKGDNIYISPFEHNSIVRPLNELKDELGVNIIILPFIKNDEWQADVEKISNMFAINKPKAIMLSHISNTTGFILPYEKLFGLGKKYNSINVLDSAQAFGIVDINNVEVIDYIVFAGHKSLYSSFGIAGIIKLGNDTLKKTIYGGTGSDTMNPKMSNDIPDGYEAGSHNIVAIQGLSAGLKWISNHNVFEHEKEMTEYLITQLKKNDKIKIYLPNNTKHILGIVSISVEGYNSNDVGTILDDEYDICVRTGYQCAPLIHDFIESIVSNGTVRISLGYFNTKEEIDTLINALNSL